MHVWEPTAAVSSADRKKASTTPGKKGTKLGVLSNHGTKKNDHWVSDVSRKVHEVLGVLLVDPWADLRASAYHFLGRVHGANELLIACKFSSGGYSSQAVNGTG
jgi:hypothetical protein